MSMPVLSTRVAARVILTLSILAIIAYVADWAVFRVRGSQLGSVSVEFYLQTPLKGQKTEYDFIGSQAVNCSRSLFPQLGAGGWNTPCWWLEKHRQRWQ